MNAAKLESDRLQRVLWVLREYGEQSTWSIMQLARVCAVNSIVSELRANGIGISCRRAPNRGAFFYRLAG